QTLEALDGGRDTGAGLLRVTCVGGEHRRLAIDARRRLFEGLLLAGGEHDARPVLRKGAGDGGPDAFRRPGDQGDLAVESHTAGQLSSPRRSVLRQEAFS